MCFFQKKRIYYRIISWEVFAWRHPHSSVYSYSILWLHCLLPKTPVSNQLPQSNYDWPDVDFGLSEIQINGFLVSLISYLAFKDLKIAYSLTVRQELGLLANFFFGIWWLIKDVLNQILYTISSLYSKRVLYLLLMERRCLIKTKHHWCKREFKYLPHCAPHALNYISVLFVVCILSWVGVKKNIFQRLRYVVK